MRPVDDIKRRPNDLEAMIEGIEPELPFTGESDSSLKKRGQKEGQTDGIRTIVEHRQVGPARVAYYTNEFWTAKQRAGCSLHEISYRACFKSQLPALFIDRMTSTGDVVYDPFSGRGTTPIEGALRGRQVISNDINPLSTLLCRPRLEVPEGSEIEERLDETDLSEDVEADMDLSMFYHHRTMRELMNLRRYLSRKKSKGEEDNIDRWIRMVATNRLTGHSKGFFSVYSLPPNQAVSRERQMRINSKLDQTPPYRDVKALILKKTSSLLRKTTREMREKLNEMARTARFLELDAASTDPIEDECVDLTVTSPPFLNIVQYANDNWLRCWFNELDAQRIERDITSTSSVGGWERYMLKVFRELFRITKEGGWVAFEVGEVKKGRIRLDESVIPIGLEAGFDCQGAMVNSQDFTKTSNIWGIGNNKRGTNSNRIVLFRKG